MSRLWSDVLTISCKSGEAHKMNEKKSAGVSITFSKPKHPALQSKIKSYYFMSVDPGNKEFQFVYYPHYMSTLNVFQQATVQIKPSEYIVRDTPGEVNKVVVSFVRTSLKRARVIGKCRVLGVIFHPAAIHEFFTMPKAGGVGPHEIDLNPPPGLNSITDRLFEEGFLGDISTDLDNYFVRIQQDLDVPLIYPIIDAILKSGGSLRLNEIVNQYGLSRRTLLRWFNKYTFCSVSTFKKNVRFRLAIDTFREKHLSLSSLSHESNYYDQSDFISHFKALTGELPNHLLNQIKAQELDEMFWKLEHL